MLERLIAAGASDAWLAPAVGRGGRARTVVTALATAESRDAVVRAMRECAGAGQGDSRVRVSPVTSPET